MPSGAWLLICALGYAFALTLSINGHSLWTDEAFSAWIASHRSFGSLGRTLLAGDSSDLQMALYYLYLFTWAKLFGTGELALRLANFPFILIFSFGLVWTSWRIFKSRLAWLAAGMLPFVWQYASEARPYMAILAFSTAALAAFLGFAQARSPASAERFAALCLASVFVGSLFHMLLLLVVAPLLTIALFYWHALPRLSWRPWRKPLAGFAAPFLAIAVFLTWTFHRPAIDYDYPHPGLRQMASVVYELAGLSGFGPNRKLSLDFRPYEIPLALGVLTLLAGAVCALLAGLHRRGNLFLKASGTAAFLCIVEAVALAVISGKQPDARHLAALVPLFLFLLLGLVSPPRPAALLSILLLGSAWLASDIRLATHPEYWKEDFRGAVALASSLQMRTGAEIALAADPVAPAYYGMDVRGNAPCSPFGETCAAALSQAAWLRGGAPAWDAERWPPARILAWLADCKTRGVPAAVLVQLDRAHRKSAWWPVLAQFPHAPRISVHGFDVVLLYSPSSR